MRVRVHVRGFKLQRRRDVEEAARESRDKQMYQLQLAERASAKLASQAAAATANLLVPTLGKRSGAGPAVGVSSGVLTAGVRVLPRIAVVPITPAASSAVTPSSNTSTDATGAVVASAALRAGAPAESGDKESSPAPASAAKRRRVDSADSPHEQGVRNNAMGVGVDLVASTAVAQKSVGGGAPAASSGAMPSKAVLASLLDYSDDEASGDDA